MRINNAEKFRNEIYNAIKDGITWQWDKVETMSALIKSDKDGKARDWDKSYCEYSHYDIDGDTRKCISLPQPMRIENNGKYIYLTVDEQGVDFWENKPDEFLYAGNLCADFYKNRMSFAMALACRIDYYLSK